MGRYRNPLLPGCHPDPSICRFGDGYVLVTSSFEYLPGLPVHVSDDLVTWRQVGHVIARPAQLDLAGLASSRGLFAPTVRAYEGGLAVVCTVVGPDDGSWPGRTGHFVVTATAPEGPWSDPIWIDGVGGIDPSLTFDGDRVWLTGTRPTAPGRWPGETDVWIVELDPRTWQPRGASSVIWHGALLGAAWAEGPHVLPRPGGGWMLIAAEGGTSHEHAVSVAYADAITGPYTGDPGNPRLTHRHLGAGADIQAVGHADLVTAQDGRTWAVLLATRAENRREGILGRLTHLVPVAWEDRRPVFAPGSGRVESVVDAAGVPDQPEPPRRFDDEFDGAPLGPEWTGIGRHPEAFAEVAGGCLRLAGGAEPDVIAPRSFLGRRLPASDVDVTVRVRFPAAPGIRGGVLLRASERAFLEVSVDGEGRIRCVLVAEGVRRMHDERDVAEGADGVTLGLEVRGLRALVRADDRVLAEVPLDALVPDPAHGFVGAWVGPLAVGDGVVEVESVRIRVASEAH